ATMSPIWNWSIAYRTSHKQGRTIPSDTTYKMTKACGLVSRANRIRPCNKPLQELEPSDDKSTMGNASTHGTRTPTTPSAPKTWVVPLTARTRPTGSAHQEAIHEK